MIHEIMIRPFTTEGEEGGAGGRGEGGLREDPRQHVQPVLLAQG